LYIILPLFIIIYILKAEGNKTILFYNIISYVQWFYMLNDFNKIFYRNQLINKKNSKISQEREKREIRLSLELY